MIRLIKKEDTLSIVEYLLKKLAITPQEAKVISRKIVKSGLPSFLKDSKSLEGICWMEKSILNEKPIKKLNFLVDNWRLAEDFIKILRWNVNGEIIIDIPRHDFLNRTLTKNGFRFLKLENNRNVYNYRFEKREFHNIKSEDNE